MIKIQSFNKKKLLGLFALLIIGLSFGLSFSAKVDAQVSINPDAGQFEIGLPIYVNVEGLTADTRYTVYTVQDGTATLVLNMTASSGGRLTFSVTFSVSGEGRVEVREITGTTTQVSANYLIVDSVNDMILPVMIFVASILIIVGIVFLVIGKITKRT
jgi:hypothetical protein